MQARAAALSLARSGSGPSGSVRTVNGLQIVGRVGGLRREMTVCRRNPPVWRSVRTLS